LERSILAEPFETLNFGGAFWNAQFWRSFLEGSILAELFGRLNFGNDFWNL
jgi:hypothetical protein